MNFPARFITVLAVMLLATVSLTGADKGKAILIKGTVIGDDGKPCDGAEIRVLRVDGNKKQEAAAITDKHGHYSLYGLPPGAYTVTAYYDGFARSRATIKTLAVGWAKVDFNLALDQGVGDGASRWNSDIRTVRWFNVGNPH
jgi:hypothetical protein